MQCLGSQNLCPELRRMNGNLLPGKKMSSATSKRHVQIRAGWSSCSFHFSTKNGNIKNCATKQVSERVQRICKHFVQHSSCLPTMCCRMVHYLDGNLQLTWKEDIGWVLFWRTICWFVHFMLEGILITIWVLSDCID